MAKRPRRKPRQTRRRKFVPLDSVAGRTEADVIRSLMELVALHADRRLVAAYDTRGARITGWVIPRSQWLRDIGPLEDVPGTPLYRTTPQGVECASLEAAAASIGV